MKDRKFNREMDSPTRQLIVVITVVMVLIFAFGNTTTAAKEHTGRLTGTVVDATSGEPLIGATVALDSTKLGIRCDLDGHFILRNIPSGTYNVSVSMIGFARLSITEVNIVAESATTLAIALLPEMHELKTVTVTAKALVNTEATLLKERQASTSISDAISAQEISRSGSGNAADAMSRVTGASVVGGKYVYVRGLGDRYAVTNMNGSPVPSADPDNQAVSMDLIPAGHLDNIVVQKTFTPDKRGNFAGGSVDIGTRDFPEYRCFTFSSSVGYNSATTGKDILWNSGGSKDWLAYEDGTRAVPDVILDNPELADQVPEGVRFINGYPDEDGILVDYMVEASESFNPTMSPITKEAPLDQSYSMYYGDMFSLFGKQLGVSSSLTYSHNYRFYDNGFSGKYRLTSIGSTALAEDYGLVDQKGTDEVLWGGMLHAKYLLHENHKLGLNFMHNRNGQSTTRYLEGKAYEIENDTSNFTYRTRLLSYTERELTSTQLTGDHFGLFGTDIRFSWQAAFSKANQEEPDVRYFSDELFTIYVEDEETGDLIPAGDGYRISPSAYRVPTRLWRFTDEDSRDFNFDITVPLAKSTKFKTGAAYLKKDRGQTERMFTYQNLNNYNNKHNGDIDAFIADVGLESIRVLDTVTGRTQWLFVNYVSENREPQNNFDGEQEVLGLYGMIETSLGSRIKLVGGARYETTDMMTLNLASSAFAEDSSNVIDDADWLPSFGLTYQIMPSMNLRGSYGRTLARPTLREMSQSVYDEFAGGRLYIGNPELIHTRIDNFDLRWEYFMRPGEIIALSGFYKTFDNPIELTIADVNGNVKPENVGEGTVYGMELEFRRQLDFIGKSLRYFKFGGNFTLVHSEVGLTDKELESIRAYDSTAEDTRPMAGQSPYILNFDIAYDNPMGGTSITLLYNIFGERLSFNAQDATPDIYEQPRSSLDLISSKRIFGNIKGKFSVKNILDSEVEFTQELNGEKYISQSYSKGRSFSIGLSYTFE